MTMLIMAVMTMELISIIITIIQAFASSVGCTAVLAVHMGSMRTSTRRNKTSGGRGTRARRHVVAMVQLYEESFSF